MPNSSTSRFGAAGFRFRTGTLADFLFKAKFGALRQARVHRNGLMDLKNGTTHDEFLALRRELEQLGAGLEAWREHLALREEIAFYAARVEEFARRLILIEKKLALQRNGEAVAIRMLSAGVAEEGKGKPGGPETAVDAERLAA